jgi:branched-chain amino acid transport system permease protein
MLQYLIAGVVIGCIYAITATSVVITYVSAGILNFSVAALAYFVGRFYYWLHVQENVAIVPAALAAIVGAAPLIGVGLWAILFRWIRHSPRLIQAAATIGLAVAIPPITTWIFGSSPILNSPGLAPQPVRTWDVGGVAITEDQVIVIVAVLALMALGSLVLRYSSIGLRVRAVVDSEALAELAGVRTDRTAAGVWAFSSLLAGLAGVLVAPIISLSIDNYTALLAAAFAAVVAARLTSLPRAVTAAMLLGIVTAIAQGYLPAASSFTADMIPSIPFFFVVVFLLLYARSGGLAETVGLKGLDRAIRPSGQTALGEPASTEEHVPAWMAPGGAVLATAIVAVLPLFLPGLWTGALALGIAFGVALLSYTLATGEGGMLWLCLITFAGLGSVLTAQFASWGIPVVPAMLAAAACSGVGGILIGMLTIRLGELYVALSTLTFGLFIDSFVFSQQRFLQFGIGVPLARPGFASSGRAFAYFALLVFAVVALLIVTVRRSTVGLALVATRWTQDGARAAGVSPVTVRIFSAAAAATVAGVGGALISMYGAASVPSDFTTFTGFTWFALIAATGLRSNIAALTGGLMLSLLPVVFLDYLPTSLGNLPPALFGLGAVLIALNPQGSVPAAGLRLRLTLAGLSGRWRAPGAPPGGSAADGAIGVADSVATRAGRSSSEFFGGSR